MKKGFALLETIIAITFLAVSLLMLYGPFTNMVSNNRKNVYYDNVSDIYKVYYLKEYLQVIGLNNLLDNKDIKRVSCSDFKINNCQELLDSLDITNLYITKYDLKHADTSKYSSSLNSYLNTLSNKGDFNYRFIAEFNGYMYASVGLEVEVNE